MKASLLRKKGKSMYNNLISGIYKYAKKTIKKKAVKGIAEYTARRANQDVDDFARDWLDIGYANPADEDEYMREYNKRHKNNPIKRDVSSWSKKDLEDVMRSIEYQYDDYTQKKVRSYFEWKYPGNQKFDATGRPVR